MLTVSRTAKGVVAGVVLSSLWLWLALASHGSVIATGITLAAIWLNISYWIAGRRALFMSPKQHFEHERDGWPGQPLSPIARAMRSGAILLALGCVVYYAAVHL